MHNAIALPGEHRLNFRMLELQKLLSADFALSHNTQIISILRMRLAKGSYHRSFTFSNFRTLLKTVSITDQLSDFSSPDGLPP